MMNGDRRRLLVAALSGAALAAGVGAGGVAVAGTDDGPRASTSTTETTPDRSDDRRDRAERRARAAVLRRPPSATRRWLRAARLHLPHRAVATAPASLRPRAATGGRARSEARDLVPGVGGRRSWPAPIRASLRRAQGPA
jgi:hypothetical protein